MARGTANCTCATCGKPFTKYGYNKYNRADADSWAAWAEETFVECDDCYAIRRQAERDAVNAAAAAEAKEAGYAELSGSAKQIAWAETIRKQAVDVLAAYEAKIDGRAETDPDLISDYDAKKEALAGLRVWLLGHSGAAWWIDNRSKMGSAGSAYRFFLRSAEVDA